MKIKTLGQVYEILQQEDSNITDQHTLVKQEVNYGMSLGRIWFNLLLPEDFKLVNEPINKKDLAKLITELVEKYGTERGTELITSITDETFKLGTIVPSSFVSNTFTLPEFIKEKKKEQLTSDLSPEEFHSRLVILANELLEYLEENNIAGYDIVKSGAKGNALDWAILTIAKGSAMGIEGDASEPAINSISDGFTLQEYHNNANEARRGMYIKSEGTAEPGALARDIVYANSNTLIGSDDCGSTRYLNIKVTDKSSDKLIGRYRVNQRGNLEVLTKDNIGKYIDKVVHLRSPIYCINPDGNLCRTCLGKISEKVDSKYIGVVTGTILNAATVESFSMKARHNSTAKDIKEVDFKNDLLAI